MRGVAQLVAYYVRDVGVVCSSHITPTLPSEVPGNRDEGGLTISEDSLTHT